MHIGIPTDPADRRKFFIVAGLAAVCLLWLAYYLLGSITWSGPTQTLDTRGWRLVQEIDPKIHAQPGFIDVAFSVQTEKPLRFIVNGAVYSQDDMDRLVELLKQLRPEGDYEMQVELLKK